MPNVLCRISAVALIALAAPSLAAQVVPRYELHHDATFSVGMSLRGGNDPPICDNAGNIYTRFGPGGPGAFKVPVVKISPDGEQKGRFSIENVPGWEEGEFAEYTVGPDGTVHVVAAKLNRRERKVDYAIITFSGDGRHRFTMPFEVPDLITDRVVAFSTGEVLLIGTTRPPRPASRENQESKGEPAQAERPAPVMVEPRLLILNRAGEVAHEIKLAGEPSSEGEQQPLRVPRGSFSRAAVAGDDGHVYLLVRGADPTILVLSSYGEAVRTLNIQAPEPGHDLLRIHFASGTGLIAQFAKRTSERSWDSGNAIYSVVSPTTGERFYDFQSAMETKAGGSFGCYTPRGFHFLAGEDGQLVIHRAAPR
ncbi:MAG TPA: hypothetical protein VGA40_00855 [Candidatus Acidoferrales bacterium]